MAHNYKVESNLIPDNVPMIDYAANTDALTVYLNDTDFVRITALDAMPSSPALVNDGGPEYPVAEAWRGYALAAEERAVAAERKLAEATEAHRALREAARIAVYEAAPESDMGGGFTITEDEWAALRAALEALAALEESHE